MKERFFVIPIVIEIPKKLAVVEQDDFAGTVSIPEAPRKGEGKVVRIPKTKE